MSFFDQFMVGRIVTKEGSPYFSRNALVKEYGDEAATLLDVLGSNVAEQFDIGGIKERLIELTGCTEEDIEDFLSRS